MTHPSHRISRIAARAGGFTLVEAAVCIVIVGVMLVAALQTIGSAADGRRRALSSRRGHDLAQLLLTEICASYYQDPNQSPTFGPESGETDFPRTFNDVDDYADFRESPLHDRAGSVIPDTKGWTWQAEIMYVSPGIDALSPGVGDTGTVQIRVTVTAPDGRSFTESAIRGRWGCADQLPASGTYDASWASLSATVGDGALPVNVGVRLLNVPEAP
jgi:type II secretory pathway pseudopilin PulG